MKVKICGITTIEAAKQAVESGADMIGFVFARSKRRVDKEKARQIATQMPSSVKKVGVFVNEDIQIIADIARTVGLDYVQLHGDETPEFCKQIEYPIIKAFQIRSEADLLNLNHYVVDYYLLDSPAGKYRGGNGGTFDWELIKNLSHLKSKVILAGGLHTENVQQAIREVNPEGIDVSSGVETNGSKDLDKIAIFIQKAKQKEKGETDGSISTTE